MPLLIIYDSDYNLENGIVLNIEILKQIYDSTFLPGMINVYDYLPLRTRGEARTQ